MLKEIIATCLLSGSIGAKSLPVTVSVHYDVAEVNSTYEKNVSVHGVYNFRQTPNFSYNHIFNNVYTFEDVSTTGGGPYYKQLNIKSG